MPKTGDKNAKPGVYKNVCCGTEIVIPVGLIFPDCARHFDVPTEWSLVETGGRVPHASELPDSKKKTA
jgi:hypothetical protein